MIVGSRSKVYRDRISRGMCGNCGLRPRRPGRTRCSFCFESQHQRYMKKRGPSVRNREDISRDPDFRKRSSEKYRRTHRFQANQASRRSGLKLRDEVLSHYGKICVCCGETIWEFLTLDHVHNDGARHRREVGSSKVYRWVKTHGYPDSFQVLCMNCNFSKGKYGICPHEKQRRILGGGSYESKVGEASRKEGLKDLASLPLFDNIPTGSSRVN